MGATTNSGINTLGEIARNTNNDAIITLIVLVIAIAVVVTPLYVLYTRRSTKKTAQYIEREDRILQVIEKNSDSNTKIAEVIAGLRGVLDSNTRHCDVCKSEQMAVLKDIRNHIIDTKTMVASLDVDNSSDKQ